MGHCPYVDVLSVNFTVVTNSVNASGQSLSLPGGHLGGQEDMLAALQGV